MPYLTQISASAAEGRLKSLYESISSRAGYVAQILQVQCHTPDVLESSLGFYIRLMKSKNGLSAARREMLAAVVSNVNDCFY